jgi:biopolymer transport protein ExbD
MVIKRRPRRKDSDSAAFSDLAFLLIIYFIVIAGFSVNKGFLMNLPAKDSTRLVLKDDILRYELDAAGSIRYDDAVIDRVTAGQDIRAGLAAHPNLSVVLTVDKDCPWQQLVSFVEMAQNLRVDSFSFTMKK